MEVILYMDSRHLTVHVRVSPSEHRALAALAHQDRRRVSEFLRELVRQEALRRGVWPACEEPRQQEVH